MAEIIRVGFGENTGTTAADSSGNGRNITSVPGWAASQSGHGTAMSRSTAGTGGQFTLAADLTEWTMMFWVRVRTTGTWASIVEQPFFGVGELFIEVNGLALDVYHRWIASGGDYSITSGTLTAATWTHLAYTYNATTNVGRVVINGTTNGTSTADNALLKTGGTYYIGGSPSQPGNMDVDDFRLFNVGMTDGEIAAVMNDNAESSGGSDGTVAAVKSTGTAAVLPPSVSATASPTVAAVRTTATATVLPPTVSVGTNGTVVATAASGTAAVLPPSVSGSAATVAVKAAATAAVQPPAVEGETAVSGGGPATATAAVLPPAVTATQNPTVAATPAMSSAVVLPPTVSAGGSATVVAVPAVATAVVLPPAVSVSGSPTVGTPPATASAAVLPPTITATQSATVVAVKATATAAVLPPSVDGVVVVVAAKATASAVVLAPTFTNNTNATLEAVTATAYAQALAPILTAVRNATTQAAPAGAAGSVRPPLVGDQTYRDITFTGHVKQRSITGTVRG